MTIVSVCCKFNILCYFYCSFILISIRWNHKEPLRNKQKKGFMDEEKKEYERLKCLKWARLHPSTHSSLSNCINVAYQQCSSCYTHFNYSVLFIVSVTKVALQFQFLYFQFSYLLLRHSISSVEQQELNRLWKKGGDTVLVMKLRTR